MRNFKRTLALVLAVIMVVGTFATVSAAETPWYQVGVDYIQGIGVDNVSAAKAEQKITRNDFVLWIAKIESKQLLDSAWKDEIASVNFTDVTDEHHKAAIAYSKQANFIQGNGDGTFAPDKATTLAEASAVIVRMMGYEDKVYDTSVENWAYNYMRAAQTYCHAFDKVFLEKTGTYSTDYELTYGEAAYILASIMNCKEIDKELSLTADGIDLGSYFEVNKNIGVSENTYYVVDMTRFSEKHVRANYTVTFETNLLDTNKNVVLAPVNGGEMIEISGEDFLREVRLALGLPATVDFMNEEEEIAVFNHVSVGSMVNVVINRASGEVQSIGLVNQTNSVVVNTYVVAKTLYAVSGVENFSNKYLGWHTNAIGTQNLIVELPSSYNETLATSWTNIVKNADGVITSAVLNFKGVKYNVGGKNADIEVLDGTNYDAVTGKYAVLTADEAVNTLINAAQGSVYAVFNDTDDDGLYETVVVLKSDAFKIFSGVNNVDGSKDDVKYPYVTALTNGETVKDELGNEITESPKYSAIGTVLFNYSIKFPNGTKLETAWSNFCSDAWTNVGEATGKLQLAIAAEDGLGVLGGAGDANPMIHPIYKVVDLATFESGIIEEIDAFALDNYYIAKIKVADGTIKTVYIPVVANTKATFDVTIGGATAEYTLDSSAWCTFLDQAKAAVDAGIVGATAEEVRYQTAAWMAGKFVNFATDKDGIIICILGTDKNTGINGFVVSADKTATGENTYNVTIAQSGTNKDATATYLTEVLASHFANTPNYTTSHGYNRPGQSGGFTNMFVEDANKPGTYVAKSGSFKTVDGVRYPVDSQGNFFITSKEYTSNSGVATLVTKEVRASASSMTDWANYEVYQAIFANGKLIDPNFDYDKNDATTDNCRVNPGTDLIYVNLIQDAGSYYIQYKPYSDASVAASTAAEYFFINGNNSTFRNRWYYYAKTNASYTAENSWNAIESGHIIDIVVNEVIHEGLDKATGLVYQEVKYAAVVGYEPYYERSYNSKTESYEYVIKYVNVVVYEDLIGIADGVVDAKNTYMVPLYYGETGKESVQVKVTTEEEKAAYTLANGFFVDDEGYVFMIVGNVGIKWETDKDGKYVYGKVAYDWASANVKFVLTDVALGETSVEVANAIAALPENNDADTTNDFVIGEVNNVDYTYATITFANKVKGETGYYPGAAWVNIDVEGATMTYTVTSKTQVVLVTPSADGFKTTVYTVKEIVDNNISFFGTEWNATVKNKAEVGAIAILGTVSGIKITADAPSAPVVKPEENTLVYLNKSAKAVVRADEHGEGWLVISDEAAIAIPSGESVGQIYRRYSTYAEAKAASIDLTIEGGNYYLVDKDAQIVVGDTSYATDVKVGKLVSVTAAGKTMADMGDGKIVDVSGYDFQWFYRDSEGNLVKASDSTNVTIIDKDAYAKLFETLEKNVNNAKATLDAKTVAYEAGKLNQTKYDYYVEAYETAVAALESAKASNLDKYFNGKFWGFANSPYYTYVAMGAGSFQQDISYLWFEYIQVGDTYCVFTDRFSVSDPNA